MTQTRKYRVEYSSENFVRTLVSHEDVLKALEERHEQQVADGLMPAPLYPAPRAVRPG